MSIQNNKTTPKYVRYAVINKNNINKMNFKAHEKNRLINDKLSPNLELKVNDVQLR